jgi:hypothetical protein
VAFFAITPWKPGAYAESSGGSDGTLAGIECHRPHGEDWCGDGLLRRGLQLQQDCLFDAAALAEGKSLQVRTHRFFAGDHATLSAGLRAFRQARSLWPYIKGGPA